MTSTRPLAEINQRALALLYRELGVVDATRFLMQFHPGYGNYTQEREALFASMTLEQLTREIKQHRQD